MLSQISFLLYLDCFSATCSVSREPPPQTKVEKWDYYYFRSQLRDNPRFKESENSSEPDI